MHSIALTTFSGTPCEVVNAVKSLAEINNGDYKEYLVLLTFLNDTLESEDLLSTEHFGLTPACSQTVCHL